MASLGVKDTLMAALTGDLVTGGMCLWVINVSFYREMLRRLRPIVQVGWRVFKRI